MKNISAASRVRVSTDGHGVVSHAGMRLLRELADRTGRSAQVTIGLADTHRGQWVYAPGDVYADLAAAVADDADRIDGVGAGPPIALCRSPGRCSAAAVHWDGFSAQFADAYMALLADTVDKPALVTHDIETILG